jgi:hypothetical protein
MAFEIQAILAMPTLSNLKRWTLPDNYGGATWKGFYSSGVGQSRDSDALERSNFRAMWKALEAVGSQAEIVREGHWSVGWVEWIAIPESDNAGLAAADELVGKLSEYPILDEDDYTREELEEANEVWASCYSGAQRVAYLREHGRDLEFSSLADLLACVRGRYFAGDASELLS